MKEQLIEFETAKLAKKKGFKVDGYHLEDIENHTKDSFISELPTQSLLQKWLREKHNFDCEARGVRYSGDNETSYYQPYINGCIVNMGRYPTYEAALEIAEQEALKAL